MQTYATIKILKEMGHKVTLINLYHPKRKNIIFAKHSTHVLWLFEELSFALFRLLYLGRKTRKMYSIDERLLPECDVTIVGSDQVWNNDITGPIQIPYFLDFVKRGYMLSFASSFGKSEWDSNEVVTNIVKANLERFKAISVREETGVSILKNVFCLDSCLVLDPTLAYGKYDQLVKKNSPRHEIFSFLLGRNNNTDEICRLVSDVVSLPLYSPSKMSLLFASGPITWLNNIKRFDYIITDSFHGLAFSLIFHKKFLVLCADEKKFTRLYSLLKLLKLEERFFSSKEDLINRVGIVNKDIDYKHVDELLSIERCKTIEFLKQNISEVL